MGILLGAVKILIVLGTLITIHELGHFLVAKACKIKVQKFAIGFGPRIWSRQGEETQYSLRLFPFGGFVQLEGEDSVSDDEKSFSKKPIYQRILVVAAGATVNILFALLIYFSIVFCNNIYVGNEIMPIDTNSIEYASGLREGDLIQKINGKNTFTEYDIDEIITKSKSDDFIFLVKRDGKKETINLTIPHTKHGFLGIYYDDTKTVVGVPESSNAYKDGLLSGDVILKINDTSIIVANQISSEIEKLPDQDIFLLVSRNGEKVLIETSTYSDIQRFYKLDFYALSPRGLDRVLYAVNETSDYFTMTIEGILSLFGGKSENVEVMGPVGIADTIASTQKIAEFFYIMAAISLSLGIFNLFPVPGLDGGKIILLIIEKLRKKPLPIKVEGIITIIGFSLIVILAIIVTASDIIALF